jgi:3-oxoacyl-[acyl-carrier protein] reductase
MKNIDLKTVIVTGASGGLGVETVRELLITGYKVIGVSRRPRNFEVVNENNYIHLTCDLSRIENLVPLVGEIKKHTKVIYGLVNNAAIGKDGILPTIHNSDIEYQIALNLTSPIILTKYISREMLQHRQGRIVNISSIVANSGYRGLSVYAATKGGLEGFSRSLSRELGSYEINVNCVAPGFMETEMTASLSNENLDRIRNRSALKRFPTVIEVTSAVKYLLSPEGSGITGTVITIDAGNTA